MAIAHESGAGELYGPMLSEIGLELGAIDKAIEHLVSAWNDLVHEHDESPWGYEESTSYMVLIERKAQLRRVLLDPTSALREQTI